MTLHADFRDFSETRQELFDAFKEMLAPLQESHKLAMVLVQFPPWFDCSSQNIKYILYVKQQLQDYQCVLNSDISLGLMINLKRKHCPFN